MSVSGLKNDVRELNKLAGGMGLEALIDGICSALERHPDALADVTYSYRLCASDSGFTKSFSLTNGRYAELGEADEADVTVTGTEQSLLSVLRRDVAPMSALVRGKIKVKGSKAALIRFAEFL